MFPLAALGRVHVFPLAALGRVYFFRPPHAVAEARAATPQQLRVYRRNSNVSIGHMV